MGPAWGEHGWASGYARRAGFWPVLKACPDDGGFVCAPSNRPAEGALHDQVRE
jgi:hypothetical protein